MNERIKMIIDHYCDGNQARFAQMMNVTPQNVNTWLVRSIGSHVVNRIVETLPNISRRWLLDGEGDMFVEGSGETYVPLKQRQPRRRNFDDIQPSPRREVSVELLDIINRELDLLQTQIQVQQRNYEALIALVTSINNKCNN